MSKYYDPNDKVVVDGDIAVAKDVNDVNESTAAGFDMVEFDLSQMLGDVVGWSQKAREWAIANFDPEPGLPSALTSAKNAQKAADNAKDQVGQLQIDIHMVQQGVSNCAHAAVDAANEAAQWAGAPEGHEVAPREYSAYHWAQKSITAQRTPGPEGPPGPLGPAGPQGIQGAKGDKGDTGPQGIQGEKGDKGDTGPQGPQGVVGPQGPIGSTGPAGPQGVQGQPGLGIDMQGTDSYANIIAKNGARSDCWVVSIDSPPSALKGDCLVSDGSTGPGQWINVGDISGPIGPQGPTGSTGPAGPMGPTGPRGPVGTTGPQGPRGAQGAQGADGAAGIQGPQGIQGIQGLQGDKGDKGDSGDPVALDGLLPIEVNGPQTRRTISILPQYLFPSGGTQSQILEKVDGNDRNVKWVNKPVGKLQWSLINDDTIAQSNQGYFINTDVKGITLTLPADPKIGEEVGIADYLSTFNSNNCILARNGNRIMGVDEDLILEKNYRSLVLTFSDKLRGWLITRLVGDIDDSTASTGTIPGQIIMWPLDTPPKGFLICDGAQYNYDDYPVLGSLLGATAGSTFQVPDIDLFPKNSKGQNTLAKELASVGTHGHTADAVPDHKHSGSGDLAPDHIHNLSINAAGDHGHNLSGQGTHRHGMRLRYGQVQATDICSSGGSSWESGTGYTNTDGAHTHSIGAAGHHGHNGSAAAGGSHTHNLEIDPAGSHTPNINEHVGTNQPNCTLVNFCIKT